MIPEQLTWKERGWLWMRLGVRLVLLLLAVWLITRFGPPLLSLFAPFWQPWWLPPCLTLWSSGCNGGWAGPGRG